MVEWKRSLYKTIVYRIITFVIGTLVALLLTGDIAVATGLAVLNELIQSANYYIFELTWSYYEVEQLKKEVREELFNQEVKVIFDYESIRDISYEMSQIDTFVNEIYTMVIDFYNKLLQSEDLKPLQDEILSHKTHFETVHAGRDFKEQASLDSEESPEESEKEELEKSGDEQDDERETEPEDDSAKDAVEQST